MVEAFGLKQHVWHVERVEQRQGLIRDFVCVVGQTDHLEMLGQRQRTSGIISTIREPELDHLHIVLSF
jgi:hypothetical protein